MKLNFTKMQGAGNDFICVDCRAADISLSEREIKKLCDRRLGIGADGVIFIRKSAAADAFMDIYNADGSRAVICGNGVRCVGKYIYDREFEKREKLSIETLGGIKELRIEAGGDGSAELITVDMGGALVADEIEISTELGSFAVVPVSTGNRHAIIFKCESDASFPELGAALQGAFPGGINVGLAEIVTATGMKLMTYERGVGETPACGTLACAAAAAAVKKGLCEAGVPLSVEMAGGKLSIVIREDYTALMRGGAGEAFRGEAEA